MILDRHTKYGNYYMPKEVQGNFSDAPNGTKVSTRALHTVREPYENSWGIMATFRTLKSSAPKETSLLTSSRVL